MKKNTQLTLPAATLLRLSPKLEALANNLARHAEEFGIATDEGFASCLAVIGCANGAQLALHDAEGAKDLEELLAAEALPPPAELEGLTAGLEAALAGPGNWTRIVEEFLTSRWQRSADQNPDIDLQTARERRVLHGIRTGLVAARESSQVALTLDRHVGTMQAEHLFLSRCLRGWSGNDWAPWAPPFVEFTATCYRPRTIERRLIWEAVEEVYPVAKALPDPWKLSLWIETGWSAGRRMARRQPDDCRKLLTESSAEVLRGCHGLYERCVLGTALPGGEVQIERATLRFFGEHENSKLARHYCTGEQPRWMGRIAFDFAYWMGIFSAFPVPLREERVAPAVPAASAGDPVVETLRLPFPAPHVAILGITQSGTFTFGVGNSLGASTAPVGPRPVREIAKIILRGLDLATARRALHDPRWAPIVSEIEALASNIPNPPEESAR